MIKHTRKKPEPTQQLLIMMMKIEILSDSGGDDDDDGDDDARCLASQSHSLEKELRIKGLVRLGGWVPKWPIGGLLLRDSGSCW